MRKFKEAFRNDAENNIIDLDDQLKHKFTYSVHRLENIMKVLGDIIPPHRHSHYIICFVKKGSGKKTIGHYSFPIIKNSLFFIPKRVMSSSKHWSPDATGYHLSFTLDFFLQNSFSRKLLFNKKVFKLSAKPYIILSVCQTNKIEAIFEYILDESKEGFFSSKNELIAVKILELLILCDRFYNETYPGNKELVFHNALEKFNELLEKNFSKHHSVKYYAERLHVHPNHLNYLTQKYSGLSAKETITNYILNEAKFLLATSSLSVKEIAYELGFEYPENFYSFFRKHLNVTPAKYRSKHV